MSDERGLPPPPNAASSHFKMQQLEARKRENQDAWNQQGGSSVLDAFGRQEKTGVKLRGDININSTEHSPYPQQHQQHHHQPPSHSFATAAHQQQKQIIHQYQHRVPPLPLGGGGNSNNNQHQQPSPYYAQREEEQPLVSSTGWTNDGTLNPTMGGYQQRQQQQQQQRQFRMEGGPNGHVYNPHSILQQNNNGHSNNNNPLLVGSSGDHGSASGSGSGAMMTADQLAERRRLRVTTLEANELQTELDAIKRDREFAKAWMQHTNPTPRGPGAGGLDITPQQPIVRSPGAGAVSFLERPTAAVSPPLLVESPTNEEDSRGGGAVVPCYCCGRSLAYDDVASYVAPGTVDQILKQSGAPPAAGAKRGNNKKDPGAGGGGITARKGSLPMLKKGKVRQQQQQGTRLDAKSNWKW